MSKLRKKISELPERKRAADIGLKHVSNGCVGWLEDGDGEHYFAPAWLLDLLHEARREGYLQATANLRAALGFRPDGTITYEAAPWVR